MVYVIYNEGSDKPVLTLMPATDDNEPADISGTYTGSGYTITIYENGKLDFTSPEDGTYSDLKWQKDGNSYTFTYTSMGADQIATFTISGNTLTLNDWGEDYTLTKKDGEPGGEPEGIMPEQMQGTYVFDDSDEDYTYTVTLEVSANTVKLTIVAGEDRIEVNATIEESRDMLWPYKFTDPYGSKYTLRFDDTEDPCASVVLYMEDSDEQMTLSRPQNNQE